MAVLKKVKLKTEKELHSIIEKEIDALEEGLEILKYEFALSRGTPDFLCVDSGKRLVVIEVKLQEDENILFQALRYYNEIDKDRYAISKLFSDKDVDAEEHPRIILVAAKFTDDIRRLSTLVVPDVELYEYAVLETNDKKIGMYYHPVSLPRITEIPPKPPTIKKLREYMTEDSLRPLFDKLIEEIKSIGEEIEEYPTQGYVGFKYKGRLIGWLYPHRKSFDIGAVIIDEDSHVIDDESTRIESGKEDYKETLMRIMETFENIGGRITKNRS